MTDIGSSFERFWPLAQASVERLLRAHHVDHADRDDIVQEVAARAFVRREQFTSLTHLTRWSCRVAANLRVDQVRRRSRISDADVPEASDVIDTARVVEGRVALEQVLSAVSRLSPTDRAALFGPREVDGDRREAVRLAVQRHRARARLAAMVEGMLGAVAFIWRGLARPAQPVLRDVVTVAAVAAIAVGVPIAAIMKPPRQGAAVAVRPSTSPVVQSLVAVRDAQHHAVPLTKAADLARGPRVGAGGELRPVPAEPVVGVRSAGGRGAAVYERHPDEPKTACVRNLTPGSEHCVDRPGPHLPIPHLPIPPQS